jgi:hypothetical protein
VGYAELATGVGAPNAVCLPELQVQDHAGGGLMLL